MNNLPEKSTDLEYLENINLLIVCRPPSFILRPHGGLQTPGWEHWSTLKQMLIRTRYQDAAPPLADLMVVCYSRENISDPTHLIFLKKEKEIECLLYFPTIPPCGFKALLDSITYSF